MVHEGVVARLDALRRTWTQHLKSIEARVEKDREAHKEQARGAGLLWAVLHDGVHLHQGCFC